MVFDILGLAFMCMIGFVRIMHQKEGMENEGVVMVAAFTCLYLHLLFHMFVWGGFSSFFLGVFTYYLCVISSTPMMGIFLCPLNLLCVNHPPPYPYIGLLFLVAIASFIGSNSKSRRRRSNMQTIFVLMFAMAVVFIE
jgi:hypothetical protein